MSRTTATNDGSDDLKAPHSETHSPDSDGSTGAEGAFHPFVKGFASEVARRSDDSPRGSVFAVSSDLVASSAGSAVRAPTGLTPQQTDCRCYANEHQTGSTTRDCSSCYCGPY